ncbi:MAG: fused MFS/spermidine synthase [Bacteroidales bacterium]|nr:fused MFS/spermidine synthase [Bacteroidales bacterium]
MNRIRRYYIYWTVFICGAVVMAFEITGARILGPYTGTSMFVWAALIGVILTSLSIGYMTGGRLADRRGSYGSLGRIIVLSGLFIIAVSLVMKPLLLKVTGLLPDERTASVVASLILFAGPALLLGMVSPYAARLEISEVSTSGMTVGNLYALSTLGSITGTLAAGFVLIPLFRISLILVIMASILIVTGLLMIFIFPAGKSISHVYENEKN